MKTVQMTLDAELVEAVDQAARQLGTSRSGFTREALREALRRLEIRKLEDKQRVGYLRNPVREDEFSDWAEERVWID